MWMQCSRAVWLKQGNRNTKFFHGKSSERKSNNDIKKLMDNMGYCSGKFMIIKLLTS